MMFCQRDTVRRLGDVPIAHVFTLDGLDYIRADEGQLLKTIKGAVSNRLGNEMGRSVEDLFQGAVGMDSQGRLRWFLHDTQVLYRGDCEVRY